MAISVTNRAVRLLLTKLSVVLVFVMIAVLSGGLVATRLLDGPAPLVGIVVASVNAVILGMAIAHAARIADSK
jgi:hypothetical protein